MEKELGRAVLFMGRMLGSHFRNARQFAGLPKTRTPGKFATWNWKSMHVGERDAFLLLLLYGTFIHNPRLFVY